MQQKLNHPCLDSNIFLKTNEEIDPFKLLNFFASVFVELDLTPLYKQIKDQILDLNTNYLKGKTQFFVFENIFGQIVGSICLYELNPKAAEIKHFYLHPFYRGKGIGFVMLTEIINLAKEYSFERLELETCRHLIKANQLYKQVGFQLSDQSVKYQTGHNNITMTKLLLKSHSL